MIDFGYTQAEAGPRIPVDIDPLYQGQGHGWVTDTKRQLFPAPNVRIRPACMEFGAIKTARFGSICLTPIHCYLNSLYPGTTQQN